MEVRRVVIREVHVDRDPVELAQPRHPTNVRRPKVSLTPTRSVSAKTARRSQLPTRKGQFRISRRVGVQDDRANSSRRGAATGDSSQNGTGM
jgi:hypothetical protein